MDWIEIIAKGGPHVVAILSIFALIVVWRYHIKREEVHQKEKQLSAQRHKERDDQYEQILKEALTYVSKNNTLLEVRSRDG